MTTYDSQKIKELVEEAGGTISVAYEADIGHSTLTKMIAGTYHSRPSKKLRVKFAQYFNVREDLIFPPQKGRQKAS